MFEILSQRTFQHLQKIALDRGETEDLELLRGCANSMYSENEAWRGTELSRETTADTSSLCLNRSPLIKSSIYETLHDTVLQ